MSPGRTSPRLMMIVGPALLYAGFCSPRYGTRGDDHLSGTPVTRWPRPRPADAGRVLCGGVVGTAEPLRDPATQTLLAPPRVCQPRLHGASVLRGVSPPCGIVSVALVRARLYRIYDGQVGVTH